MPWITFHGTFQRFIAQDGKYDISISQTNNSVCYRIVIVLDGVTKQQQPFMLIKKYLLG